MRPTEKRTEADVGRSGSAAPSVGAVVLSPGDRVQVFNPGPLATGVVVRAETDPQNPGEDPARVLVRWDDDATEGWPLRRFLRKLDV